MHDLMINLRQLYVWTATTLAPHGEIDVGAVMLLILLTGILGGLVAKQFRQPLILGYILAGALVGVLVRAWAGGEMASEALQKPADIGVALLLFSMGLEFSKADLIPIRRIAVWGALLQVMLTFLIATGIARLLGCAWTPSMLFGVAFVSTSTAVVLKTLTNSGQMGTLSSRVMIGMSIVQDLAVVPLILIVCNLSNLSEGISTALKPLISGAVFLVLMMTLGAKLVPYLMKWIARWNSKELFLLTVTLIALGIGYIAGIMQVSFSFGAFLAGIVLSDSDYGKKALSEMMPLRDLFAMLFFVSIGMLLDVHFLVKQIWLILLLMIATGLSRTIILGIVTWIHGYRNVIPVAMLFGMMATSEIAFIVIQQGRSNGIFNEQLCSLILAVVVCSMICGPLFDTLVAPVYKGLRHLGFLQARLNTIAIPPSDLHDHVVIAGSGAIARSIAHLLARLQLPYLIIDNNHHSFQLNQQEKLISIYGEPQQEVILRAAKIEHAKIFLSISPNFMENLEFIHSARELQPKLPIITRADSEDEVSQLHQYKIFEIVQPKFEAGLEITRQALLRLNVPMLEVQNYLDSVRHDHYRPLYEGHLDYKMIIRLRSFLGMIELNWVLLPANSPLIGHTIAQSQIRTRAGVSVVSVMREGKFISNPPPSLLFQTGDLLGVIGTANERTAFGQMVGAELSATPAAAEQNHSILRGSADCTTKESAGGA